MSLGLGRSKAETARTFACPSCGATLSTIAAECDGCHLRIDPKQAQEAADLMDRVNEAISRFPGGESIGKLFVTAPRGAEILLFGLLGTYVMRATALLILAPFFLIAGLRWHSKFGSIPTGDPEYLQVKKVIKRNTWVGGAVCLAIAVWLVLGSIFG